MCCVVMQSGYVLGAAVEERGGSRFYLLAELLLLELLLVRILQLQLVLM